MYQPSTLRKKAALQEAVRIITQRVSPVAIYCLGFRKNLQSSGNVLFPDSAAKTKTAHFYLLVFAEAIPENAIADISNIIRDASHGSVTVTLLLHSVYALRKSSGNQSRFFMLAISSGDPLFYSTTKSLAKMPSPLSQNMGKSQKYWQDRHDIAKSLLDTVANLEPQGTTAIAQSMLHIAVGQITLGLIEVFLGYRPNHFALGYLFGICGMFTNLHEQIFPYNTGENRRLFDILATNISTLRQNSPSHFSTADIAALAKSSTRFLAEAARLVQAKFLETSAP